MGALSFSSSEDSVSASFLLRCLSQHTFTKNTGEKPDVLDDEEADLLVLLIAELELLLVRLLLLIRLHRFLLGLFSRTLPLFLLLLILFALWLRLQNVVHKIIDVHLSELFVDCLV